MNGRRLGTVLVLAGALVLLAGLLVVAFRSHGHYGAASLVIGGGFALICFGQAVRQLS